MIRRDVGRTPRADLGRYVQGLLFGVAVALWAAFVGLSSLVNPAISAVVAEPASTQPGPLLRLGASLLRVQSWAFYGAVGGSVVAVVFAGAYQCHAIFGRRGHRF